VTPRLGANDSNQETPCSSCGGRGEKLRSSRRLHVINEVEDGKIPFRVCQCPDCGGSGQAEAA
jgi:DnaJ-class molecular chaperone